MKYQVVWKHSKVNRFNEPQNQIPKQSPFIIKAESEEEARTKFSAEFPTLFIHEVIEQHEHSEI